MTSIPSQAPVAIAFSGGLDTSYLAARFAEAGHPVTTIAVNTGQWEDGDLAGLAAHSARLGSGEHLVIDARDMVYDRHIAWLIRGNVLRGGVYPLCVGVERVVQASEFAQAAADRGIDWLVHGSTGAGNDQVRFDVALRSVAPGAQIVAPIRDEALSRETTFAWLQERGMAPVQGDAPYSYNEGLWGVTAGGAETHDPWSAPSEEAYPTTTNPTAAPAEGTSFVLRFEQGLPVALDGETGSGPTIIRQLVKLAGAHGVGRGIHLGDTILGIKGRIAFEAPAAAVLVPAHRELEKLVLTGDQRFWKDHLGNLYGQMLHGARYHDPLMRDLEAFLDSSQKRVCGEVRVVLRQGTVSITGVRSPYSMAAVQDASYGEGTGLWSGADARGFTTIFGVSQVLAARAEAAGQGDEA